MSIKDKGQVELEVTPIVIASGGTTTAEIDLYGTSLVALDIPASFEGTSIAITASNTSGGTFKNIYVDGANLGIIVAASKYVGISNLHPLVCARFIKLVSNNAVAADRTINLITRKL